MNCLIVSSVRDTAGKNITKTLKENFSLPKNFSFLEVDKEIIFAEIEQEKLEGIDLVVFASKHRSESGKPTLTCHSIGNFGRAEFGGKNGKLVPTNAHVLASYLRSMHKLNQEKGLGFEVSLEVTHHGPWLDKPSVFIEIGSNESAWNNSLAAEVIAETIAKETLKEINDAVAIGLGGGHYAPDFTKLALRKPYSLGHICPVHNLQNLDSDLLSQMVSGSGASEIILQWKGLKNFKEKAVSLSKQNGLPFERVQKLLKK